jgi:hypothetical protein
MFASRCGHGCRDATAEVSTTASESLAGKERFSDSKFCGSMKAAFEIATDRRVSPQSASSGGTKLTRTHANKLGKPVLQIYDTRKKRIFNQDSLRLEIQALTYFLCSNKVEVLNVAGPSGIEGTRRLRMDADDVALFS